MKLKRKITVIAAAAVIPAGVIAGLAATAGSASAATCTTSSATGACGPYNDPSVFQGPNGADLVVQNDFSSIPQTLTASGPTAWTVSASTTGQSDQTSVKSYPATQVTYTLTNGQPEPSSDFGTTLTSNFTNVIPSGSGQDFEYAVDDWLANPAQQSWTNDFELMIWTYTNGQVPAGSDTGQVYTDAAGTQWEVWVAGGGSSVGPDSTVSFVRKVNATSGSLERWGFYHYMQAHGMLNSTFGIDQTNYGLEICGTGGSTKTYGISGYNLVVNGVQPTPTPTTTTPTPTPTTTTPTPTPTTTSPTPTPSPTFPPPAGLSQTPHVYVPFAWGAVSGASSYEFQLQTGGVTTVDATITATRIGPLELTGGTSYQWRVRASGGTWSAFRSFTTP